jgi:hypothetical protein
MARRNRSAKEPIPAAPDGFLPWPKDLYAAHSKYCYPKSFSERDLAWRLEVWRNFEKGILPEGKDHDSQFLPLGCTAREFWKRHVEETKARIEQAILSQDTGFLKKLTKASKPQEYEFDGTAEAYAIRGFRELTGDRWPTKKEIREYVTKYFPHDITARQWPRIFAKTGLKDLPEET